MCKNYNSVVVHYSECRKPNTLNCRYVTSFSYIEENQDVAWFNSKQYVELFGGKRSLDNNNKLLAILRIEYKDRTIRRRYKCDQSLCLADTQLGLTSESMRILFDDMPNASKELISVSKGDIWDTFMFYWNHPFHATRISFKLGVLSMAIGILSLVISIVSFI